MLNIFKKWKWTNYIEGLLLMIVGICTIVFSGNESFYNVLGYIAASILIINGISGLVYSFVFPSSDIIGSICLLVLGIWSCFDPLIFVRVLPVILGVTIMIIGLYKFYVSIFVSRMSYSFTYFIYSIIMSSLCFLIGLTIICLNYSVLTNILLILVGVALLYLSLAEIMTTLYASIKAHKVKKAMNDNIIDQE